LYWLKGQVLPPPPEAGGGGSEAAAAHAPSPPSLLDPELQEAIELARLRSLAEALDQQIARYSRDEQEYDREIKEHMERVHEYNEVKDVAQALMGRLATIEGVLTRDLYKRYELGLDD